VVDKHITLAGAFNLAMGILGIVGVITGSLVMSALDRFFIEPRALSLAVYAITIGFTYIVIFSAAQIIGAVGLLKRKSWSRILMIIVSAFKLLNVPLGTALGIYTIWVLIQDETKGILDAGSKPQSG
jgi:hypothetical protein